MHRVYVHGSAVQRSWGDAHRSLPELIFNATRSALLDSGYHISQVDSVVLAAHDLTDGRSLSSMVTAPAAGAYLKDEVRLGDDGAAAFIVGTARVRCGESRTTVVAAWGRASEHDANALSRSLFDPFFTRPLGMTEVGVSALRAAAALRKFDDYRRWRERAALARTADRAAIGTLSNPPFPLRVSEAPRWADVVAAVVLSADPGPVEIRGVGMSTDPYQVGDRDLLGMPALAHAAKTALTSASMTISDVDVLELDGLTLFDESLAVEAVGAAPEGSGMQTLAESTSINPDGGYSAGYCAPAMGLVKICNATSRLQGSGRTALATGSSVVAAQSWSAVALERR